MATKFAIETIFKAVDRVSGPLSRMTRNVSAFANSAERSLRGLNNRLKTSEDILANGVKTSAALAAAGGAAVSSIAMVGAEYEQQLVNAASKFPGAIKQGSEAFAELDAVASRIGATTEFSASQAAGAINFLAMAGFDAKNAIGALPSIVDMATASSIDLAEASDIASDALGQFNMTSKDVATQTKNLSRIIDVMTKAASSANVTIPLLFESFKDAAPVAAGLGGDVETLSAMAGTLAGNGIKGATAGTALKAAYSRLSAPTGGAAKALKSLGVGTRDASGNMLDMLDIIDSLAKKLGTMGTASRAELVKTIFGEEALSSANVLLANAGNMRRYREELRKAAGATKDMASIIRNTTGGDIKGMSSAVEGLTISIFKLNKDAIRESIQSITQWVRGVTSAVNDSGEEGRSISADIVKWTKRAAVALGVLTAAWVAVNIATMATTVAMGVFTFTTKAVVAATWLWGFAAGGVTKALVTLRAAVLALNLVMYANPIGLVIAAIAALSAVVAAAVIYWDDITAAVGRAWEMFAEAGIWADIAVGALALLTGPIGWLAGSAALITKHWEPISGFFTDLWAGIVKAFDEAIAKIKAAVAVVVGAVKKVIAAGRAVTDFVGLTDEEPEEQTPVGGGAATGINRRVQVAGPMSEVLRRMAEDPGMAEIVLRNETNATAEVSSHSGSIGLKIANSGGFQ